MSMQQYTIRFSGNAGTRNLEFTDKFTNIIAAKDYVRLNLPRYSPIYFMGAIFAADGRFISEFRTNLIVEERVYKGFWAIVHPARSRTPEVSG